MPAPKTVTKVTKDGITFTSNVDRANYFLYELTRAAYRDIAKLIKKRYRDKYYTVFKKDTGQGKNAISHKVYAGKRESNPRLDIGIRHAAPGKPVPGFYSFFHEIGTTHEPKRDLLYQTVKKCIPEIVQIESQYLSAINDEHRAESLIDESEDEG